MAIDQSRNIPLPIQRSVRQRCGFGCVICGLPLYEYEHMLGWAQVQRHVAEEITLLCDRHHREKTGGLLPIEKVKEANAAPYNLRVGTSKPFDLHYEGTECELIIGDNRFTTKDNGYGTVMVPVSVDDIPLIGFILGDGHLLMNLNLFDEFNKLVLRVRNNELIYRPEPWDIELVGRNLIVREAQRKFLIDISFEAPNRIVINKGRLLCNGVEIIIKPDHILITNNSMTIGGCTAMDVSAGLVIGTQAKPLASLISVPKVSRYLGDRSETEKWIKEVLSQDKS